MYVKKRCSIIFLIILLICSFAVFNACEQNVGAKPITKLVVTTMPKVDYYLGDSFELNDAEITVYYENNKKEVVKLDMNMISDFNSNVLGKQTLTIQYKEATAYVDVNVSTAPVFSLQVQSTEHKKEYVVGEKLDVSNLKILVTYSNGYTSIVDVTADMVTGFDTTTTGTKRLIITYGNRDCGLNINVVKRSVMQMQLVSPKKLNYIVGDTVNLDEGQLFVSYNDNTSEYLNLNALFEAEQLGIVISDEETTTFTKSQAACTVTLYYLDKRFSYAVVVENVRATSAAVTKDIAPQIFEAQTYDFSSGEITLTYNNGKTKVISFVDEAVSYDLNEFDINKLGTYKIKVTADGLNFDYNVTVVSAKPSELVIIPTSNAVYQNDAISITDWKYKIKLNNGKYNLIPSTNAYEAPVEANMFVGDLNTDIDNYTIGAHKYEFAIIMADKTELKTKVTIEVLAKQIVSAEFVKPNKLIYSVGDELSLVGAKLRVTYNNDDTSEWQNVTADMLVNKDGELLSASDITKKVADSVKVYVRYYDNIYDTEYYCDYDVKVIKKATSIELLPSVNPNEKHKDTFVLGEDFDYSQWIIKVTYADGSNTTVEDFSAAEWKFTNTDLDTLGAHTVFLYYGEDVYLEFEVTVTNEITSIYSDNAYLGFVTEGLQLDLSNINLKIKREDNTRETVPVTQSMTNYVPNSAYKAVSNSYFAAYVNASEIAKATFESEEWVAEFANYYTLSGGQYSLATSTYDSTATYYVYLPSVYSENWSDYYYNFYTLNEDGTGYVVASETYNAEKTYYLSQDNTKDVQISYLDNTIIVKVTVISKKITSATVTSYKNKYILADTQWDKDNLGLSVAFNNGTTMTITSTNIVGDNGIYNFVNNGLSYRAEIGTVSNGQFSAYNFATFKSEIGEDKYVSKDIALCIFDATNSQKIFTDDFTVFCFENLVSGISLVIGKDSESGFTAYDDQIVYVNKGNRLFVDGEGEKSAYVINSDGNCRFATSAYIHVEYGNGDNEYVPLATAMTSSSFAITGYNAEKAGVQSVTVDYLLSTCTFTLTVKDNQVNKIELKDDHITVIEGMKISSDDLTIIVSFKDADGDLLSDNNNIEVDFYDVTCNYSINDPIGPFTQKDDDGRYCVKDIAISYGGVTTTVPLCIRQKTLSNIGMKTMPQQIYIEDASNSTLLSYLDAQGINKGSVLLTYNNGTTQTLYLDNGSLRIDASEFNANLELTDGGEQSQTIKISYTDENNVTKETSYNVIIKDRKYLAIEYVGLNADAKYTYQYGTGESAGPEYNVTYYADFYDNAAVDMIKGAGANGTYKVQYESKTTGEKQDAWPTEVDSYKLIISYAGDTNNNAFYDDTVTIVITRKEIAISIDDIAVTYGDKYIGSDNEAIGIQWEMKAVINGLLTDNPYCYDDDRNSVVDHVVFDIYDVNGYKVLFESLTVNDIEKFVISAPVGNYTIVPTILLNSDNYYVSTTVTDVNASLRINQRKIVVVAKRTEKIYGENDPTFLFEIYDFVVLEKYLRDNGELSANEELTKEIIKNVDFATLKNAVHPLVPFGDRGRILYYFDDDYTTKYTDEALSTTDAIYIDAAPARYMLTRSTPRLENVGLHSIYSGSVENSLSNYSVEYVGNYLEIKKADLVVGGEDVSRDFGTTVATLNFGLKDGTSLKNGDVFGALFNSYFNTSEIIYYNTVTHVYTKQITDEYYDDWAVLYRNVKFFTNKNCTTQVFGYLDNVTFSIIGQEYSGNFGVMPIKTDVGQYYVQIQLDDLSLNDYAVTATSTDGYDYSFVFEIKKINVSMNVESLLLTEESGITDHNAKTLIDYFGVNGLTISEITRSDLTNTEYINNLFKSKIIAITYRNMSGQAIDYKLNENNFDDNYTFVKQTEGVHTGVYTIVANCISNNFAVTLSSYSTYAESYYMNYFYDMWNSKYTIDDLAANYDENAYFVLLPNYIDIKYGNAEKGNLTEIYSKKALNAWALDSYYSFDGTEYNIMSNIEGLRYSIVNNDVSTSISDKMNIGFYTGTLSYSFFDTDSKDYLYLGDTVMLSDTNTAKLLNYVLNGTVSTLTFTESFQYSVTPIQISATVDTSTVLYDGEGKTFGVTIDNGYLCVGDSLDILFNVAVNYNAKLETTNYTSIVVKDYSYYYKNTATDANYLSKHITSNAMEALDLTNAGTYTIGIADLGNKNYTLIEAVDGVQTITSINIPVFITGTGADGLTITKTYNGQGIQPIDSAWAEASSSTYDYSFGSDNCFIVKEYYTSAEKGVENLITTTLNDSPRTLTVFASDGNGGYPVNVKKTNGQISGYDIDFYVNSDFVNYSVEFVYKDTEGDYVVCDDAHKYSLVIQPKELMLYNFYRINEKSYDGNVASVSAADRTRLTIDGDVKADNVTTAGIQFTFTRLGGEGSTYISNGGTRYTLIDNDDVISVGTLLVSAYYSDNYSIVFMDKSAQYSADNHFGIYKINKVLVTLTLNDNSNAFMKRQYDGYGLTKYNNIAFSGDFYDISKYMRGNVVVDNYGDILYLLDLKYYNTTYSVDGISSATVVNEYTFNKNGANAMYNVGYYWYNLRGVFQYEGNEVSFVSVNNEYSDWLSWNYNYKSSYNNAVLNGCDGIYQISERELYLIVNPVENEPGKVVAGTDNAPKRGSVQYTYLWTYDGKNYTSSEIENDLNTNGGIYSYGLYVLTYDAIVDKYIYRNITSYNEYGSRYLGDNTVLGGNYNYNSGASIHLSSGLSINDASNAAIPVLTDDILAANTNFVIVNNETKIGIRALTLNVKLKMNNADAENSNEAIYGRTLSQNAISYVLEPQETYPDSVDLNLRSEQSILNIIYGSSGSYILYNSQNISVFTLRIGIGSSVTKIGDWYCTGGDSLKNLAAGEYHTGGSYLSSNSYKYNINVISTPFSIKKQEIAINGINRVYFDKTVDNYAFTIDGETNAQISVVLSDLRHSIFDNTNIDAVVGSYLTNGNYFVMVGVDKFVSTNDNYSLALSGEISPENADKVNYIYIPLTINKANVSIDLRVKNDVQYGDIIKANNYDVVYTGLPQLNTSYQYSYFSYLTQETIIDNYDSQAAALQDTLRSYIETVVLNTADIISRIATSNVGEYNVESLARYAMEDPLFDNYSIEWGKLYYTVVKKIINVTMTVIKSYHYDLYNNPTNYFSALWSEKDEFYYAQGGDDKLSYGINVQDFMANGESYTTLLAKLEKILGITYNAESDYYVYRGNQYDSLTELLSANLRYIIVNSPSSDTESVSAGLRYIKLTGLASNNFAFNYIAVPVMLYPEIASLGEYKDENTDVNANVISDTEASITGVTINKDTKLINNLSMYIQLNFIGMNESEKEQYLETNSSNDYSIAYYDGMSYNRSIALYYISGASVDNDSGISVAIGDIITVQFVITETFYSSETNDVKRINRLVSNYFKVRFMKAGTMSGEVEVVKDKNDGNLISDSNGAIKEFGEELSGNSGKYYFASEDAAYNGQFDIITVRAKLSSTAINSGRSYEITIYENTYGKLVMGFVTGTTSYYYTRMYYSNYYIKAQHTTAQAGATYYSFARATVTQGENISANTYYVASGNGYVLTSDLQFDGNTAYYTRNTLLVAVGSSLADSTYVDFYENVITQSLVELFDATSHTINIYIDKVGELANVNCASTTATATLGSMTEATTTTTVTADRIYYLYVTIDNTQYIFSYIGGSYTSGMEDSTITSITYEHTQDTSIITGKEYYSFSVAELTSTTFSSGVYYVNNEGIFRRSEDLTFVETTTYYEITLLNNDEIVEMTNVYEKKTTSNNTVDYYLNDPDFFKIAGKTGIGYDNLNVIISKYSLKNRIITMAGGYTANVILWPAASDSNEFVYVTNKASANSLIEGVINALKEVSYITIGGGNVDDKAYGSQVSDENTNNRITYLSTVTDYKGGNVIGDIEESGLYTITYMASYNFGTNNSIDLGSTTIKVLVTSDAVNDVALQKYSRNTSGILIKDEVNESIKVSHASPKVISGGSSDTYYYTENLISYSSTTYIFDNVNITNAATGDIWVYLRMSDTELTNYTYQITGLDDEVGLALRIRKDGANTITTLYAVVYESGSDGESTHTYWSMSTTDVTWENAVNIIKVDYSTLTNDCIISVRIYQYDRTTDITSLAWQQYVRTDTFDGISQDRINNLILGTNNIETQTKIMGFGLKNASLRLLEYYTGMKTNTDVDFVKYDYVEELANATRGQYVSGDTAFNDNNCVYMAADQYGVPYSYTGNSVYLRFSLSSLTSSTEGFDFYYANNVPYVVNNYPDSNVLRQRGMFLRYRNGKLSTAFFKYNYPYSDQTLYSGIDLFDSQVHSITITINDKIYQSDELNTYLSDDATIRGIVDILGSYYIVCIKLDNLEPAYAVCPVYNNLTGLSYWNGTNWVAGQDAESRRDLYFLNGVYYMGFFMRDTVTQLNVYDCTAFSQKFN